MMNENTEQLIDIYDMWYQPFWSSLWFYYSVIIVVSLVLLHFMWFLYKKYIYKKTVVDCSVIALQELESLKRIHIVTPADSKNCYFKVSLIIKQYLSVRYGISCVQLTDIEIVTKLHGIMSDEQSQALNHIFHAMKFTKFAHEFARHEKLEKDIQAIMEFIESTSLTLAIKK